MLEKEMLRWEWSPMILISKDSKDVLMTERADCGSWFDRLCDHRGSILDVEQRTDRWPVRWVVVLLVSALPRRLLSEPVTALCTAHEHERIR
jgi:hypothetical protein